ncbi:MAG: DUF362 domain-containing protein [Anaerolineae bacterium]|nr:DUF362 domain-containing protein [Anaerolineae bacterium]
MSRAMNRRVFLKGLLAVSASGAALSACAPKPAPTPTAIPPTVAPPTTIPPTAAPPPTTVPPTTVPPTATAIPPTATVAAVPSAAPSATAVPAATAAPKAAAPAAGAYLAVAKGANADPREITRRAIAAIGGIERFVKKGNDVIIKPNVCTAYYPFEYAATTNPEVVAAIVQLCLEAGAKRVRVMDFPFGGSAQASYDKSGIGAAVKTAGGAMEAMSNLKFRDVQIPQGKRLKQWKVYGDIQDADVVINVPIAKNHSGATLTLGMKNLMGVVLDRNGMHSRGLHQSIADINTVVRPQLTVVDAIRILTNNGPTGGNLNDVKKLDTVIASADIVAADAFATTLFNMKPADIDYIRFGDEMGLGKMDLKSLKIEQITV